MTTITDLPDTVRASRAAPRSRLAGSLANVTLTAAITWIAVGLFVFTLLAVVAAVVVYALSTSWGATWLPGGLTLDRLREALEVPGMVRSLWVTVLVSVSVVVISLVVGVPAAYVLARKSFPGRSAVMLVLLLPVVLTPLTYAVQLAALMYKIHLGGSVLAVVLVNLVPILPLVILVMIPFVEQISPNVERAAKVFGAGPGRLFTSVLVPLLVPGIVAAGILSLVRVLGSFELTFFVSSAKSQTLIVAIFGKMADPSAPPVYITAAMTVFYMVFALVGLLVGLRFSDPASALGGSKTR